jgi:guanylate kinase
LVERLVQRDRRLWLSRSWTTRARRPGEPADAYRFVAGDEFQAEIERGGFLEWAEFLGERYGTPRPDPPDGCDAVLEIDVQGARQVLAVHPDALLVFVDAPDKDAQQARLRGRGDGAERVARRLEVGDREREAAAELGMHVVVNDELERAVDEVAALIASARRASG